MSLAPLSHVSVLVSRTWRANQENQRPWTSLNACHRSCPTWTRNSGPIITLIDLLDDEEYLAKEQETLDLHDDLVTELSLRVNQVIAASTPSSDESSRRIVSRKLTHLQKSLTSITAIIGDASAAPFDACLLRQYEERTNDINKDLVRTRDDLHRMDLDTVAR